MRILLVNDHPVMREGLHAEILRLFADALIIEPETSAEALKLAASLRPDLSIVDPNLRDLNGLKLAYRLLAHDHRTRILFLSAIADPWIVREALSLGVSVYLADTGTVQELHKAIRAVMAGSTYLRDDAAAALRRAGQAESAENVAPGLAVLSPREQETLKHIAKGGTTKAIALEMRISPKTVETHRSHIMRKLHLDNVASLTCYAIRHGLHMV
jgi:DNA-binding NarL/FixJ family response regulator